MKIRDFLSESDEEDFARKLEYYYKRRAAMNRVKSLQNKGILGKDPEGLAANFAQGFKQQLIYPEYEPPSFSKLSKRLGTGMLQKAYDTAQSSSKNIQPSPDKPFDYFSKSY